MSMHARDRQKQHERFLLEQFLRGAALDAEIVEEREAPDFVVCYERRRIGVEVTQLFVSHAVVQSMRQVQESVSTRIVSRAREFYEESGGPPAHVGVYFAPRCDLSKVRRDDIAGKLSTLVRDLHLTPWQRLDCHPEDSDDSFPEEVSFLHALGVPVHMKPHWTVPRADWVVPLTSEVLQARVDEKAELLPTYREVVEENWLVIIADGTKPSGLFEVRAGVEVSGVSSPFSRTFCYVHPDRVLIEVVGGA